MAVNRNYAMALAVSKESRAAIASERYDLIDPDPDGWLSLADLDDLNQAGELIARDVRIADPHEPEIVVEGDLVALRGGYVVAIYYNEED